MQRVHVVGRQNSGKTTLIVELVAWLAAHGFRPGTIKHTHHHHELDTPGKDSFRHREAGAHLVAIVAPNMQAAFWPCPREELAGAAYERLDRLFGACDLVLVEGDLNATAPKVEVWRPDGHAQPLATDRSDIRAVITDDVWPHPSTEIWSRHDIEGVARRLLRLAADGDHCG